MAPQLLLYGATGYSIGLAAIEAKRVGLELIIGGRNEAKVKALSESLNVPFRVFSPDDSIELIDAALQNVKLLVSGAGPFHLTTDSFMDACIRNKIHYMDISAELDSMHAAAKRDTEAQAAGVMLLPSGCSGVEAILDCVGGGLLEKVPHPVKFEQILEIHGPVSRGTLGTIRGFWKEIVRLEDGEMVPHVSDNIMFDFRDGRGPIECFPSNDPQMISLAKAADLKTFTSYCAKTGGDFPTCDLGEVPEGPSEAERAELPYHAGYTVTAADGSVTRAVVRMINGYDLIAHGTVEAASRILDGRVSIKPGFQTPYIVFGKDYPSVFLGTVIEEY